MKKTRLNLLFALVGLFCTAANAQTLNYIGKFNSSGTLVNSSIFDNSSVVGIGTNNPFNILHIKKGTDQNLVFESGTSRGGPDGMGIVSLNDANTIYKSLSLQAAQLLLQPGSGNVGIGTGGFTAINSTAALFPSSNPKVETWTGTAPGGYAELMTIRHPYVNSSFVSRQLGMVFKMSDESTSGESAKMGGMMLESGIEYGNIPKLSILTGNARRMTIDYYGNIGIGTTTPSEKLEITGTTAGFPGRITFGDNNAYSPAMKFYKWTGGGTNYAQASIGESLDVEGGLSFQTGNGGAAIGSDTQTTRMVITQNGNVAIGTTDPKDYKLAVNGSAIATAMTVKLQGNWPDYVFKPTYKLPELSEVKAYIDANQHLPEIPSESEIKKSGINLGEVNALLLKKMEELTLYVIEKDAELKKEHNQNQAQQKQLDLITRQLKGLLKQHK